MSRSSPASRLQAPTLLLAAFAALLFIPPGTAGERLILRIYCWPDYFAPETLASFEEKYDCTVATDSFDSNEDMLKYLETGQGGYDIITPSSYMSAEMEHRGLLRPIDRALVPNIGRLDPAVFALTGDPEQRYSVPYTRTVTGVGYNAQELNGFDESWTIFGRGDLQGRMILLDDMRETLGAALKVLGHSLNTRDEWRIEEAGALVAEWRRNCAIGGLDEVNLGLAANRFAVAHDYNGDVIELMREKRGLGFFIPREGSAITTDDFVITAAGLSPDLAHAFINHLLDPETAAANMESVLYYMPIPEALAKLPPDVLANPAFSVPAEVLAKCEVIQNLGPDIVKYEQVWEQVKNSKMASAK